MTQALHKCYKTRRKNPQTNKQTNKHPNKQTKTKQLCFVSRPFCQWCCPLLSCLLVLFFIYFFIQFAFFLCVSFVFLLFCVFCFSSFPFFGEGGGFLQMPHALFKHNSYNSDIIHTSMDTCLTLSWEWMWSILKRWTTQEYLIHSYLLGLQQT